MIGPDTTLKEISRMPGVKDLPMQVRLPFMRALRAEQEGDHAKAADLLDQAVEAEKEAS